MSYSFFFRKSFNFQRKLYIEKATSLIVNSNTKIEKLKNRKKTFLVKKFNNKVK